MYVLIVEDDSEVRAALMAVMHYVGVEAHAASSAEEAFDMVADQLPDVIILDLMMPRMHGQQFLATLQSDHVYEMIPAIVITGMSGVTMADLPGSVCVLRKPFQTDSILREVFKYITLVVPTSDLASEAVDLEVQHLGGNCESQGDRVGIHAGLQPLA